MRTRRTARDRALRGGILTALVVLLAAGAVPAEERAANLLGYVRGLQTRQPITGASVKLESMNTVRVTNALGFFAFTDVPLGTHELVIESLGHEERRIQVRLSEDKSYETDVELSTEPILLEGLTVR
ncbi:MAG TPA: hypothetical protein DC060_17810, partial [Gemmatimonadetes bacterium]|nr:hypothetical protein [Gemmatimonadota bacterium]